jgi:type II secretory pathway pseudopilin PulG
LKTHRISPRAESVDDRIRARSGTAHARRRAIGNRQSTVGNPRGMSLLDLLAVLAAMVIVLGMMVSLARYVRGRSADEIARRVLADLDVMLERYLDVHNGQIPQVPALLTELDPPENRRLMDAAQSNNAAWVKALQTQLARRALDSADPADNPLSQLPAWLYDERALRDPWGTPIVLMPTAHPRIGMDIGDRPFFVSAGPDRSFLTRQDNLYSYETRGPVSPRRTPVSSP